MTDYEPKTVKLPPLSDGGYNIAKDIVTIYGPAAITLYSGLAILWEWANSDKFVATAGLILTFLGAIVKVSSSRYAKLPVVYDGQLTVNNTDPEKDLIHFNLDKDYNELGETKELRIQVVNPLKNDSSR